MKPYLGYLLCLILYTSCNRINKDQTSEIEASDSITNTVDSVPHAQKEIIQPTDTTIQTIIMQWQNVSVTEFGTSYEFMDRYGNQYSTLLNIPGFDFYNNIYFTAKYAPGAQFPTISMSEKAVGVWYRITIKKEYGVDEDGVGETNLVVTEIKPLND